KKRDATGIKRHIDLKANLDEDWYRKWNAKEEKARRDQETKTNHGTLTVEALTKAGKARIVYI
ncbi:MAG TPA: hypothetical protein DIU35_07685, partial [Candidatus Latescibacteria bacterium]|nr:hypothetical protein [Candidatus Latescibacterota bacterium]